MWLMYTMTRGICHSEWAGAGAMQVGAGAIQAGLGVNQVGVGVIQAGAGVTQVGVGAIRVGAIQHTATTTIIRIILVEEGRPMLMM